MKSKPRKYYYKDLEQHDRNQSDSTIRLLEMTVDNVVPETGYSVQFWQDVKLYGVDEAILYLKDTVTDKQYISLTETWERIRNALTRQETN